MPEIKKIRKLTDNPHLNLYQLDAKNRKGREFHYYVASRAKTVEQMKIHTRDEKPDGVLIYSLAGKNRDRIVLVRQYRYSIDDYIYEFPAGLVDDGEEFHDAAVREMREETGLVFHPLKVDAMYQRPFFTTIGMTDECCSMVYGYADGTVSEDGQEDTEEIHTVIADREEVRRILKEERVALPTAYMLLHFLNDQDPFAFLGITGQKG